MRLRIAGALMVVVLLGCSHHLVLAHHSGWTVRYAHHTGRGETDMLRGTHPDIIIAMLEGRGRFINETGASATFDRATRASTLCHGSQCVPTPAADAIAAVNETTELSAPEGTTETDIAVQALNDRMEVAELHTDGARFTGAVRRAQGSVVFTVEVRWVDQAGEPSAEVAKEFFVAPLLRLGAHRLVDAIRHTTGLPLMFDVRIVNTDASGDEDQGEDVYRAISIGNAPPVI